VMLPIKKLVVLEDESEGLAPSAHEENAAGSRSCSD